MTKKKAPVSKKTKHKLRNQFVLSKFIVQPVLLEKDGKGRTIREVAADPIEVFYHDDLAKWARAFPKSLAELNAADPVG